MKVNILLKIIFYYFYFNFARGEPIVKIDQGFLNGTKLQTRTREISAFLGIPYAEPPIGDLRFKNPVPGKKWNGIRAADQEGNSCIQIDLKNNLLGEEDCLFLNVYTPFLEFNSTIDEKKLLPVMVWVHGGGFYFGSASPTEFGPKYLLDKNIILVSMNYRLGIFGFFTTGDEEAPGNFGLKDQVLALKWVQKNIHNFGGNPDQVTLFGESAGGASVNLHAISDLTDGLFHQYIIQSGCALSPWVFRSKEEYKPYINEMAKNMNCFYNKTKLIVKCLRGKSAETLLKAKSTDLTDFPVITWTPTDELESENAFLTDSPHNLIAQNKMKDYPFISGTVADEGLIVTLEMYANNTSVEEIKHLLEKSMNSTSYHYMNPDDEAKFREMIEEYYFNNSFNSVSTDKILRNYTNFVSDSGFLYPQALLIDKMAKQTESPFYFYSFGYFSLNMSNMFEFFDIKRDLGVPHAEELSYIFSKSTINSVSEKDEKILNLMVDMWTSFAINGQPSSDNLEDPYLWQPYVVNQSFLQIGNISNNTDPVITMNSNYFSHRLDFWRKSFPMLLHFI